LTITPARRDLSSAAGAQSGFTGLLRSFCLWQKLHARVPL
jgi:hypothetical protein